MGSVHVGIGGWDYAPWRGTFYPRGLPKSQELAHAASRLTAIEINGTFYRTQSPESFARWAATVPPGFIFSVKAARAAAYGTDPAARAASIARFTGSGLTQLGPALGPLLWQFPATRKFDQAFLAQFLADLPTQEAGTPLRHVLEAKHPSFTHPDSLALLAAHQVALCTVEAPDLPATPHLTTDFAYLRLQATLDDAPEGYDPPSLDRWADWTRTHRAELPAGIFIFFIAGAKHRAPDAAQALLRRSG